MSSVLARVVFVGNPVRDVGDGNPQPTTVAEFTAELIDLALRGHCDMPRIGGMPDPEVRRVLRRRLSRPGRPGATYHREWVARFRELRSELVDGFEFTRVDGEAPLTSIGICLLVALEDFATHPGRWRYNPGASKLAGDRAARRVWNAVKPLI